MIWQRWMILASAVSLAACATTRHARRPSDPYRALAEARTLYAQKDRPVEAEKRLHDAITAFTAGNDEKGLADAYDQYAYLLESPAVTRAEKTFRKDGFLDRTVTYDNRLQKSIAYFDRAAPIYARLKRFDKLTENNVGRGIVFANLANRDEACASFEQADSFHDESERRNPDAKPAVPSGFKTWGAYLASLKKWAGCGG